MSVLVQKMDGSLEPFDIDKLKHSLRKAGASEKAVEEISTHIASEVYNGITTQEIYAHAFEILKHYERRPVAARYSLKRAIFDLGPSGFPFEQFIAQMFKALGYKNVQTGRRMKGSCAEHEIDVYAEKDGKRVGAELKFHNTPGFKTDLKVALYVSARFNDLSQKIDEGWLITNTKFTQNVKKFSSCSGLKLLGWDYPHNNSLVNIIEKSAVHPITALTSLNSAQKRTLIERDVVICKQALKLLHENDPIFEHVHANKEELKNELESLCKS